MFMDFDEKVAVNQIVPCIARCHFPFASFNICSSSLASNSLTLMLPNLSCFWFRNDDRRWFSVEISCPVWRRLSSNWFFPFSLTLPFLFALTCMCHDPVCIEYLVIICCHLAGPWGSAPYFAHFFFLFGIYFDTFY